MIASLNYKKDAKTFTIATVGEFCALVLWIYYLDQGYVVLSVILLLAGFLVERLTVLNWVKSIRADNKIFANISWWLKAVEILIITISEIVIWMIWYYAFKEFGHLVSFLILLPLMQIEHSVEMALLKKESWKKYILKKKVIVFTLFETVGAALALYFYTSEEYILAALALLIGLSVEHVIQGVNLREKQV